MLHIKLTGCSFVHQGCICITIHLHSPLVWRTITMLIPFGSALMGDFKHIPHAAAALTSHFLCQSALHQGRLQDSHTVSLTSRPGGPSCYSLRSCPRQGSLLRVPPSVDQSHIVFYFFSHM